MWKIILLILALFVNIIGLSQIIHRIWMLMLKPKERALGFLCILLKGDNSYGKLCFADEYVRWYGEECIDGVIAIDCGLSQKEAEACNEFCKPDNNTYFYSASQIVEILKKEIIPNAAKNDSRQ